MIFSSRDAIIRVYLSYIVFKRNYRFGVGKIGRSDGRKCCYRRQRRYERCLIRAVRRPMPHSTLLLIVVWKKRWWQGRQE